MDFNLKVTQEEVWTIWQALVKLPYNEVAELIDKLMKQVKEQKDPKVEE